MPITVQHKKKFSSKRLTKADHGYDDQELVQSREDTDEEEEVEVESSSCTTSRILSRLPATTMILLFLLFLWSSSTTYISSSVVQYCVTSRKLNNDSNLYCLSAGTEPSLELPSPEKKKPTQSLVKVPTAHVVKVPTADVVKKVPTADVVNNIDMKLRKEMEQKAKEAKAIEDVQQQLKVLRSYNKKRYINYSDPEACVGRGIYVYDLPSKFNTDLITDCTTVDWMHFCEFLSNNAFGDRVPDFGEGWFNTHQYSLEPIIHNRILKHPCRVDNPQKAKLFFVPFYAGLDILKWHFNLTISTETRDELSLDLIQWLKQQSWWNMHFGADHVFALGKITWDFRRPEGRKWGNTFLNLDEMQNPMKLIIERNPWHINEVGVPHPSFFHPTSDQDIASWQHKLIQTPRKHLVSFAGASRPGSQTSIRSILIDQCNATSSCEFFNCKSESLPCRNPGNVIRLFMESEFCFQPMGDSPTRKSFFDSLVSGCIPVLFTPYTAYYQYPWYLPADSTKYSVFIDQEEVRKSNVNVIQRLENISVDRRIAMRRLIVNEILPGLVYADPNGRLDTFDDAVSVAINALLEKMSTLT